jgi:hypothetical protein
MTDTAISPLRRRMIEDMMICKLAPKTQASYIRDRDAHQRPRRVSLRMMHSFLLRLAPSSVDVRS